MAYDTHSGQLVQFGGVGMNGPLADTLRGRISDADDVVLSELEDWFTPERFAAFRRIQIQSMNTRKSMREIAEAIIIANSV